MDKDEAERVAEAIRLTRLDWIQVQGIEHNSVTRIYIVKCLYRRKSELQESNESWTTLSITSPRQWIALLTQHHRGLEFP